MLPWKRARQIKLVFRLVATFTKVQNRGKKLYKGRIAIPIRCEIVTLKLFNVKLSNSGIFSYVDGGMLCRRNYKATLYPRPLVFLVVSRIRGVFEKQFPATDTINAIVSRFRRNFPFFRLYFLQRVAWKNSLELDNINNFKIRISVEWKMRNNAIVSTSILSFPLPFGVSRCIRVYGRVLWGNKKDTANTFISVLSL